MRLSRIRIIATKVMLPPWLLYTNTFVPNRYQKAPRVANGYFGQTLPAEGVGYCIQRAEDGSYVKNSKCFGELSQALIAKSGLHIGIHSSNKDYLVVRYPDPTEYTLLFYTHLTHPTA